MHLQGHASIKLGALAGRLRGYAQHQPRDTSVEERITALESNIGAIHERITSTQNDVDGQVAEVMERVKAESQVRATGVSAARAEVEELATGGLHWSAIGAIWLFVGVFLSTAAIEISQLLN